MSVGTKNGYGKGEGGEVGEFERVRCLCGGSVVNIMTIHKPVLTGENTPKKREWGRKNDGGGCGMVWHIEFVCWVCWVCVCASLATAVRCGNVMWGNVVGLDIYVR